MRELRQELDEILVSLERMAAGLDTVRDEVVVVQDAQDLMGEDMASMRNSMDQLLAHFGIGEPAQPIKAPMVDPRVPEQARPETRSKRWLAFPVIGALLLFAACMTYIN